MRSYSATAFLFRQPRTMAAAHTASSLRGSSSLGSGIRTPSSVLLGRRASSTRSPSQAQLGQPRSDEDEEQHATRHDEATHLAQTSSVWPILQMIRSDINTTIDTGLSWEELTGHELNFAVVRPLAVKYSKLKSPAILYAMLLTRIHFIREADRDLAYQNINQTRSDLCEILAIKLLRTFAADGSELVIALSTPFWPLAGSSEQVKDLAQRRGYDCEHFPNQQSSSTLQLAIYSQAKKFIATPLVQKCVDGIWNGQIVLGNSSAGRGAIIEDSYKRRPVSFYDPRTAPFLDYHRLRVPRIRSFLEVANFAFILAFYVLCLASKGSPTWTAAETLYTIWLTGLALDELAQFQEHTSSVYFGSLFNVLDALFCINGFCWLGIRISALVTHNSARSDFSFDVLSLGAILLCPRLASLLISDNVLMLALRAMVVEFGYFFGLALVFFSGFLWTFFSLADSPKWTPTRISWLMLRFTFGNTISFEEAQQFSTTFGPILVVAFTILSQTLLLTILISLLSATFARVAAHAQEESLFQHSFATLQGASSEALFSYFPPLNIICLLTILPASFTLTPRWVHKLNVFVIRTTHLPILLAIRVVQQLQWGRTIELASEKSSSVFGRWRWGSKRGHPDLIEIVFGDLADKHGAESELAKGFPAAKPLSSTYAHQSVVHNQQADPESSETQSSKRRTPLHTDVDRVQWADETYDLPDSPGATLRKAKAAAAGNASAWSSLARRDTFNQLPRDEEDDVDEQTTSQAGHSDKSGVDSAKTARDAAGVDTAADADGEDDDRSGVLVPIELVDEGPTAEITSVPKRRKRSGSKSSKSSHTSHKGQRKGGTASMSPLTRVLTSSKQALTSQSSPKVPVMTRAQTVAEGSGGGAVGDGDGRGSVDGSEKDAATTTTGSGSTAPSSSPFSAYRLYRSSRSALLGKRRALSEDDVTAISPSTLVSGLPRTEDDEGEEATSKRQVRVLPNPTSRPDLNLATTTTSSTTPTAGLTSLSRILNRKDTFDAGDTTDVDTALEQRTSAGGGDAVGAIRDVMLSFLERLDDQAESVQRIETLLAGVLRERRGERGEEQQDDAEGEADGEK